MGNPGINAMRGCWGTMVLLVCCSSVRALAQQDFSKSGPASGEDLAKLNSIIKMTNTLMKHGRLHEADSLLKTNLKCCFPNNFSLLEQYGLVLHHLGKQKLAIKQYEKALHLSPHHLGVAGLLSNLALSQEEVGNDKSALKNYKEAIEMNPRLKGAHVNIANFYRIHRKWDEAAKNLKLAIAIDPKDDIAIGGLGAVYMDQHKWPQAEKAFRESAALNKHGYAARTELGNVLLRMNRDAEAKAEFEEVLAMNKHWYRAHDGLAAYFLKNKEPKLAELQAKLALSLRGGDQYSLDLFHQAKHSTREAEKHSNTVVAYSDQYDHITKHKPHPENQKGSWDQQAGQHASWLRSIGYVLLVAALVGGVGYFVFNRPQDEGYHHVSMKGPNDFDTGFEAGGLLDDDLNDAKSWDN